MSFRPGSHLSENRKNQGFLRFSDFSDSCDQWQHRIPDSRRFLRHDQKNQKHFYFGGPSQTVPDVYDFAMSVNMKFACLGHRGFLSLSFLATKD